MFLSKYTTMSATATDEQIREIKRLFRKSMNGVVAASMREKGMAYRVNFGLTLPLIKRIASSITPNEILAERARQRIENAGHMALSAPKNGYVHGKKVDR